MSGVRTSWRQPEPGLSYTDPDRRPSVRGGRLALGENQGEQAREAGVELGPAQPVESTRTLVDLFEQAGGAQNGEVVTGGGLRHRQVEGAAGKGEVRLARQRPHDRPAHRVGQRLERLLQAHLARVRVPQAEYPSRLRRHSPLSPTFTNLPTVRPLSYS
ncbi:hypothetical protein FRAHR75_400052 [Frankia sp. Hr75.2]|nr:hypothetical protein FRAHR75_400052 [Frankia sp. Hr75.2]